MADDVRQNDFLIRLRPASGDQVTIHRLRRLLKLLGRSYRLSCIDAREVPQDAATADEVPVTAEKTP
jgi:hypothetical protein